MTVNTPESFDRRRTDVKMDTLIERVDDVIKWQKVHLLDYHANLKAHEADELVIEHRGLMTQVDSNRDMLHRIVAILDGEDIYSDLDGHIVDRRPGMRADLAELKQQSTNGGLRSRIQFTTFQKSLVTASLGLLTAIVVLLTAIITNV